MNTSARRFSFSLAMLVTLLALGACGVKPAHVKPPEGAEHEQFPAVYPAPVIEIQPGMENKDL